MCVFYCHPCRIIPVHYYCELQIQPNENDRIHWLQNADNVLCRNTEPQGRDVYYLLLFLHIVLYLFSIISINLSYPCNTETVLLYFSP